MLVFRIVQKSGKMRGPIIYISVLLCVLPYSWSFPAVATSFLPPNNVVLTNAHVTYNSVPRFFLMTSALLFFSVKNPTDRQSVLYAIEQTK